MAVAKKHRIQRSVDWVHDIPKLNQDIAAALSEPETQERLAKIGLVVVASPQSGLTDVLQRDVPKWGKAVRDSGAVAE
jgi:tripartite-type tricarboxylate transporter receptor subunit TctC